MASGPLRRVSRHVPQQLCADLSARNVIVERPETRWFLSGRAVVLVGRSAN